MSASLLPPAPDVGVPAELAVSLAPGARVLRGGRTLIGGSPLRLVSLTEAGAGVVAGWRITSPVGEGAGRRRLARRLLDAGLLTAEPPAAPTTAELTVVVPVRDRAAALERCLDGVLASCQNSAVIVVDDGSAMPAPVAAACVARGVRLIRCEVSAGPAAARNLGLAECRTPFVGFVDSDVVLPAGSAHRLLGHLSDPCVAAVAPRVRALEPSRGWIGGYERRHSALDMGTNGGFVAPGRALSYVPSTTLFVRRGSIVAGFDQSLRTGEDVDLVWRLCGAGWRVRYAPEIEVHHEHRASLAQFVAGRRAYARSGGMLARRHPDALPAVWVSPAPALAWALALSGRPRGALAAAGWAAVRHGVRIRRVGGAGRPRGELAGVMAVRVAAATGLTLAHGMRRPWLPPLLAFAVYQPRVRAGLLAAFAAAVTQDALAAGDVRALPGDAALRVLEEVVAALATWEGCLRAGTVRPLLPSFTPSHPAAP
jgi:mycofactocin system glycosyltransferase